jgi:hypothetical protein
VFCRRPVFGFSLGRCGGVAVYDWTDLRGYGEWTELNGLDQ